MLLLLLPHTIPRHVRWVSKVLGRSVTDVMNTHNLRILGPVSMPWANLAECKLGT